MTKRIFPKEIDDAYETIKGDILQTPLEYSPVLSEITGARVFLKMEHLQVSGSFKIRGVLNKIRSLDDDSLSQTLVAASTGNHASAFAYASEKFGFQGELFMPQNVSKAKSDAIKHYNLKTHFSGVNSVSTELNASEYAKENGYILVHPYNDVDIITGQGTLGVEIEAQLPEVDCVIAPIGGGGLISGLCSYFSESSVKVIGCQPENASEMYHSLELGEIVAPFTTSTIADATAGGVEKDSLTYDICKSTLDSIALVTENDIEEAIYFVLKHHHTLVEPGAALPVATLMKDDSYKDKNVVLVLTGKKICNQLLTKILNKYGSSN